jgi:hypothetical protein
MRHSGRKYGGLILAIALGVSLLVEASAASAHGTCAIGGPSGGGVNKPYIHLDASGNPKIKGDVWISCSQNHAGMSGSWQIRKGVTGNYTSIAGGSQGCQNCQGVAANPPMLSTENCIHGKQYWVWAQYTVRNAVGATVHADNTTSPHIVLC